MAWIPQNASAFRGVEAIAAGAKTRQHAVAYLRTSSATNVEGDSA